MRKDEDKHSDSAEADELVRLTEELERRNAALETQVQEQDRNRLALLHMLEELEREHGLVEQARREWTGAFDAIRDPVFVHDTHYRILRANRAYAARAGSDFAGILGRPYWEVFPRRSGPLPNCKKAIENGNDTVTEEFTLDTGEIFVSRAFVIRDAKRRFLYAVHVFEDVTEKRRAEAERRVLSEALRQAAEAVIVLDAELRITYVNPAFQRVLGYTLEEILGKPLSILSVPGSSDSSQPAEIARRVHDTGWWHGEVWRRSKDGTAVPTLLSASAIRDEKGVITGYVGAYLDLRDIKRAEETLRASEEKFRSLVETTTDFIWEVDEDGVYTYASPQVRELLGYAPEEIVGKTPFDLMPPAEAERLRELFKSIIANRRPFRLLENVNLHRNGRAVVFETSGIPLFDRTGAYKGCRGIDRDITDRTRAARALKTLSECNAALVHAPNEQELLQQISRVVVETGGYAYAWIGYIERDTALRIRPMAQTGFEPGFLESLPSDLTDIEHGAGPSATAIREGAAVVARDVTNDPALSACHDTLVTLGVGSIAVFPLMHDDEPFGMLNIYSRERDTFDRDELMLLAEMAEDLNFGILTLRARVEHERLQEEHLKTAERLKETLSDTIRAVALTVEKRDPYTAGHQNKVADLCVAIGTELGLPEDRIEGMRLGATIHDIGKIYVPAEILNRPGRLTPAEFEIIKSHPQIGYEIVKDVKFPWPVAETIRQHHEHLDGSGYPRALKGEAIILEARILAVADTVEAMASHRPYRPAHGVEAALVELERHRGDWYDPAVVDACLKLFREKRFAFVGE